MPRLPRGKAYTKVYHVILRGNSKQDIFLDKQDYTKIIKEIYNTKEKYQYNLYVYCLMPNHIHLVIYDKNNNLSKAIQSLAVSYSSYWNKKYERVGHLFQNRFISKEVENAGYLKNLCRYIHQNPYKAGISKTEEYQWSSYKEYISKSKIVDKKQVLLLFDPTNEKEAIKQFVEFHKFYFQKEELLNFLEYELGEKLSDERANKYIADFLEIKNCQEIASFNIKKRNEYLKKIKNIKGISKEQIGRITGLSGKIVQRAMK